MTFRHIFSAVKSEERNEDRACGRQSGACRWSTAPLWPNSHASQWFLTTSPMGGRAGSVFLQNFFLPIPFWKVGLLEGLGRLGRLRLFLILGKSLPTGTKGTKGRFCFLRQKIWAHWSKNRLDEVLHPEVAACPLTDFAQLQWWRQLRLAEDRAVAQVTLVFQRDVLRDLRQGSITPLQDTAGPLHHDNISHVDCGLPLALDRQWTFTMSLAWVELAWPWTVTIQQSSHEIISTSTLGKPNLLYFVWGRSDNQPQNWEESVHSKKTFSWLWKMQNLWSWILL